MSALTVLATLADHGIRVAPNPPHVRVAPADRLTPELIELVKAEKPALLRALEELQHDLGDDWPEIAADPQQLKAACELTMVRDMRRQGIVPDHYTATTTCRHCGPVPIFEGLPDRVDGCPWCFTGGLKGNKS